MTKVLLLLSIVYTYRPIQHPSSFFSFPFYSVSFPARQIAFQLYTRYKTSLPFPMLPQCSRQPGLTVWCPANNHLCLFKKTTTIEKKKRERRRRRSEKKKERKEKREVKRKRVGESFHCACQILKWLGGYHNIKKKLVRDYKRRLVGREKKKTTTRKTQISKTIHPFTPFFIYAIIKYHALPHPIKP